MASQPLYFGILWIDINECIVKFGQLIRFLVSTQDFLTNMASQPVHIGILWMDINGCNVKLGQLIRFFCLPRTF